MARRLLNDFAAESYTDLQLDWLNSVYYALRFASYIQNGRVPYTRENLRQAMFFFDELIMHNDYDPLRYGMYEKRKDMLRARSVIALGLMHL